MSKRTEVQMYLWDLDKGVRRQALAVWIGEPILLLAGGGAGWAPERFVPGYLGAGVQRRSLCIRPLPPGEIKGSWQNVPLSCLRSGRIWHR